MPSMDKVASEQMAMPENGSQGGLTAAQQQTSILKGLAAALHRGSLVDGNTLSASFQSAHRCLHSTQAASAEDRQAMSQAALELLKQLTRMQEHAKVQSQSPAEGLEPLPLEPPHLQELLADLSGRKEVLSAIGMAVAAGALQQAQAERVEVKDTVARQLKEASLRVLEAADDIIVSVKSGSAVSSGERERAIMGALPAAASLAVQSLLSSAPQKQLSSPLTASISPRLPPPRASKDCLVYLEDIISGLVDIAAPLKEDVPVRHELLWQLAAVLKAQQPLWLVAGASSQGPELQSRLVSAQHELFALSGLLKADSMWVLDLQKEPPSLALSTQIAGQQAAASSLECAAQLAASAWRSGQHSVVCTTVGALLSRSFESLGNGRLHTSQHQQAALLLCARVIVLSNGDEKLVRVLLPQILDLALRQQAQPHVLGCAVYALAHISVACARNSCRWGFDRASEPLLKLYRQPAQPAAAALLHGGISSNGNADSARSAHDWEVDGQNALADALCVVGTHATAFSPELRSVWQERMVDLFLDTALLAKGGNHAAITDLGALLQPLSQAAAACRPAAPSPAVLQRAYLLVWLYVGIHNLAGLWGTAQRNKSNQQGGFTHAPPAWQAAAGMLAAQGTPWEILAGADVLNAGDNFELDARLQRLGSGGIAPALATRLVAMLPGVSAPAGSPAITGHLLATVTANLAQASFGPLQPFKGLPALQPLLSALEIVDPASPAAKVLQAAAEASLNAYAPRIQRLREGRAEAVEALAGSLITQMATGTQHSRSVAGGLLQRLVGDFPGLRWSLSALTVLYLAASGNMGHDEGRDTSDGAPIYPALQQMLRRAADTAPGHTEALVHELLLRSSQDRRLATNSTAALLSSMPLSQAGPLNFIFEKAKYNGAVSAQLKEAERQGSSGTCLVRLADELQSNNACSDINVYNERCLSVAAALIAADSAPAATQQALLSGLCCSPAVTSLDRGLMPSAVASWHWVAAAAPQLRVPLVSSILKAWQATAKGRKGLFDRSFDPEAFRNSTDAVYNFGPLVDSISAHYMWLTYLDEVWKVATEELTPAGPVVVRLFNVLFSVSLSSPLTQHPSAVGPTFFMLRLALRHAELVGAQERRSHPGRVRQGSAAGLLQERILSCAFAWFSAPVAYFGGWTPAEAREQAAIVRGFAHDVDSTHWVNTQQPENGGGPSSGQVSRQQKLSLLKLLLQHEMERLQTWARPLDQHPGHMSVPSSAWQQHAETAWTIDPRIALALLDRFPGADALRSELENFVAKHAKRPGLHTLPEAASLLATPAAAKSGTDTLQTLQNWAPAPLLQALVMMGGPAGRVPAVREYALRSLQACNPDQVAFFLPQLVQQLRGDDSGAVRQFLFDGAKRSRLFAHHLVCTLRSEARPPDEAFNPTVKRSGWKAPEETGLWDTANEVQDQVMQQMPPDVMEFLTAELGFFDSVTGISGALYSVPKDERKAGAVRLARELTLSRNDLYLPTNPHYIVKQVIPESATPMQSAAKVPILVAFEVNEADKEEQEPQSRVQACIFKVGDDCRQDVLALQVIGLLKNALRKAGLPLYLAPYGVLPTAYECGIIEVVPNCNSRAGLGETADGSLYEIFRREFGAPGTACFEAARHNFVVSEAGYAVASYLLQAKDRHNGNILIDREGHLVHIDFGFILEISPGGNMKFESAAFKLSHEMTLIVDPGGKRESKQFKTFEDLVVRGFLVARGVAEGIIATVSLMSKSGLPCYGRGHPLENLKKRFHLEMSDSQAAAFMRKTVHDAYDKWTTGAYDYIQYLQNSIPK